MKGGENRVMKRLAIRKTAGLMALIMTISLLLPVIAHAAVEFVKKEYSPVSGQSTIVLRVTEDTYNAEGFEGKDTVSILVYTNRVQLGLYDLVYSPDYAKDGAYYYVLGTRQPQLQSVTESVYLNLYSPADANVLLATYQLNAVYPIFPPIFGGGGGVDTTPTDGVVKASPDGTVDANALKEALKSGSATVEISGDVAKLPASALTEGGVVTIVSELGSYELPLDELDLEALADELGIFSLDDLVIVVTIAELEGADKEAAEAAIEAAGGNAVSAIVEFKVEAVAGNATIEIAKFGQFVKRTLALTGTGDNLVGVRINEDGTVSPVPTQVGKDEVVVYSNSNSVYAVIDVAPKSFSDLVNHWAKDEVTALANKLIINGTGAGKFSPKRDVTRAEFAAMIVRALGLKASGEANFSDVASSAWYAEAVAAAAEAGIVNGYTDGTFRPNNKITRQELAAMVVRAQKLAGLDVDLSDAEVAGLLSGYKDAGQIGAWARAELAAAIESGIVQGTSANTVSPTASANRAEAAVMIYRFLGNVDFI